MKGGMFVGESSPMDSSVSDSNSIYQAERLGIYESIKGHHYGAQNFMHESINQKASQIYECKFYC